jgi:hypothetical protein
MCIVCCKTSTIFLLSKNKSGWWGLNHFTEKIILSVFLTLKVTSQRFAQSLILLRSLFNLTEVISGDSTMSNSDVSSAYIIRDLFQDFQLYC